MIFLYFFCSGSIKIFGGLICVQRFYNLILKTLMSLFLVQSLKERQWWMKIMLWILWLISSWQWPYFFPSETLIFFWPCIGLKKFFFGTVLYQLLIKYYQTVIAQKLALWFNTWRREATGEKRISPPFWLLKNLGYLIIVFFSLHVLKARTWRKTIQMVKNLNGKKVWWVWNGLPFAFPLLEFSLWRSGFYEEPDFQPGVFVVFLKLQQQTPGVSTKLS